MKAFILATVAGLCPAVVAHHAAAQDTAAQDTPPAVGPLSPLEVDTPEEAEAYVERVNARYREMERYSDRLTLSTVTMMGGGQLGDVENRQNIACELDFERGGRVAFRSQFGSVISNGERVWVLTDSEYIARPAPDEVDVIDLAAELPFGAESAVLHPLYFAVMGGAPVSGGFSGLADSPAWPNRSTPSRPRSKRSTASGGWSSGARPN